MQNLCTAATETSVSTHAFRAYHGTSRAAATSIAHTGFTPSTRAQYGPGVYLCRDADDAASWAGRVAACDAVAAAASWSDVNLDEARACALIETIVPAGLRAATLTMQRTAWDSFYALGDTNGTLVERYSSDEETQRVGMCELEPQLMVRYAHDERLDLIEIVLDRPNERVRTSQVIVLPHAAHQLQVRHVSNITATNPW